MKDTKLAIIYYSATGVNHQLASWAKEAAQEAGASVRMRKIQETAPDQAIDSNPAWRAHIEKTRDIPEASTDDLLWADAILFSVPTRFGNLSSQAKLFIDLQGAPWSQGKLANKVVSGMTSAQNPHGGQEMTLLALYTSMMHWGAIIVPPGYTDASIFTAGGNPYGTSVQQGQDGSLVDDVEGAVKYQAKRTLAVAAWLKAGKAQVG